MELGSTRREATRSSETAMVGDVPYSHPTNELDETHVQKDLKQYGATHSSISTPMPTRPARLQQSRQLRECQSYLTSESVSKGSRVIMDIPCILHCLQRTLVTQMQIDNQIRLQLQGRVNVKQERCLSLQLEWFCNSIDCLSSNAVVPESHLSPSTESPSSSDHSLAFSPSSRLWCSVRRCC